MNFCLTGVQDATVGILIIKAAQVTFQLIRGHFSEAIEEAKWTGVGVFVLSVVPMVVDAAHLLISGR